jgi:hypothetical protein
MTNDHRVFVGRSFLDIQLDRATTQMRCIWDLFFVPFIFLTYIDNHRFTALRFRCRILQ